MRARRDLVDRDDRATLQSFCLFPGHAHDLRSKRLGEDVLRADLKHAGPPALLVASKAEKSRSLVSTI
jgi:hypothetical protein